MKVIELVGICIDKVQLNCVLGSEPGMQINCKLNEPCSPEELPFSVMDLEVEYIFTLSDVEDVIFVEVNAAMVLERKLPFYRLSEEVTE